MVKIKAFSEQTFNANHVGKARRSIGTIGISDITSFVCLLVLYGDGSLELRNLLGKRHTPSGKHQAKSEERQIVRPVINGAANS